MTYSPVILVGMNNPHGGGSVLSPDDPGSAGERLYKLSGMSRENYEYRFVRMNLVTGKTYDAKKAERRARKLYESETRHVVVLGSAARSAVEKAGPIRDNFHFVPHPSGRCHCYNDPKNRRRVRALLRRLAGC